MIDETVGKDVKKEVKKKSKPVPEPAPEAVLETVDSIPRPEVPLSDKDNIVLQKILSQKKEFPSVDVVSKRVDPFREPDEIKPYLDKYDVRWLSKDKRMLDRSELKGWKIVNRIHWPKLPTYMFGPHGAIENQGMILAFRPKELSSAYRARVQQKSIDAIRLAKKEDVKDKDGSPFYTAKLSTKEEEESGPDASVQGRDFE